MGVMRLLRQLRWRPSIRGAIASFKALSGSLEGLPLQAAVVLGFILIFGLWVVSGYSLFRRLAELEYRSARLYAQYTRSEESLSRIRTQILLSAIYRRDALLDTEADTAEYYRQQLQASRDAIDAAFKEYVPVVTTPSERQQWNLLQQEVDEYWETLQPDRLWDPRREPWAARVFLRGNVISKREMITRISEVILALNRKAFEEQQGEIAQLHAGVRGRFLWTSALTVLLGIGVAVLVSRHTRKLEGRIRQQHLEDRRNKEDLQRLSARLVEVQEEQSRKIARELHDEIGQALTAIKMDVALAERALESPARARPILEEARSIADRTLQVVRDLSQLLRPAILDDLGLPEALRDYLRSFSRRTGIRTELVQDRIDARLAPEVELCAYRIIQEALTNVARHARASFCRVYLHKLAHTLLITVEDDGQGFELERVGMGIPRRGLGLVGIQERASSLSGTFRLESQPGKGTRLTVELPVSSPPADTLAAPAEAAGALLDGDT